MPGLIPDHVLEQVRNANSVEEIIGSYFPLKRAGANLRALCPFHKEKTPSFNVSPSKQIWHCFGCGEGGDVFKFVMRYENIDFVSAVQRLAERAGITLEYEAGHDQPRRDEKDALFKLHARATAWYHQNLLQAKAAQPARDYLQQRGLSLDLAQRWQLGYAPDRWDGLIKKAAADGYPADLLETAGLALRSERGCYDRFRGRLLFPIADDQGRIVGFSGRILSDASDQPKYVNSPETPLFHKGRVLFAFDRAKRPILDQQFAVVCEGQIDTIACHENGLDNVVAPQGTALTEQHARILKRYTEEVVLMFDGDNAGQKAVVRNAEPLWETGFVIRVALLPQGHDPDSFLRQHGTDALADRIQAATPFIDFLLNRLAAEHDPASDRGKTRIAGQMVDWLVRIRDPILQATYAQRTASRLGLPETAVRQLMKQYQARRRPGHEPAAADDDAAAAATDVANDPAEELLLQLGFHDERVLARLQNDLDQSWLSGNPAGELLRRVLGAHASGEWTGPAALIQAGQPTETDRLVARLMLAPALAADRHERAITECLRALRRRWTQTAMTRLRQRLNTPGLSSNEISDLQQQLLDLRRQLDHIG